MNLISILLKIICYMKVFLEILKEYYIYKVNYIKKYENFNYKSYNKNKTFACKSNSKLC